MPRVQRLDISPVHQTNGWLPPPSLPVCKQPQVLDRREDHPWPFLFSYREDGRCVVNRQPTKSKYQEAYAVGEAQF